MAPIVADMIRAGPSGTFADGQPKVNGIVIGFMSTLGNALAYCYKGDRAGGHNAHDPSSA
jgi:hypothetical protein